MKTGSPIIKKPRGQIGILRYHGKIWHIWYRTSEEDKFTVLDDKLLSKKILNYENLNENSRLKKFEEFLNECKVIFDLNIPKLRNCRHEVSDFKTGAHLLLATTTLFQNQAVGYYLVACVLSGMRCVSLRQVCPDFRPRLHIRSLDDMVAQILSTWVESCIQRENWKRKKNRPRIARKAVLNYRKTSNYAYEVDKQLIDFDRATLKVRKRKLNSPVPYEDTLLVVIDATGAQLNDLAPLTENSGAIYVNCKRLEGGATIFTSADVSSYSPDSLDLFRNDESCKSLAWLLRCWGDPECNYSDWAEKIVRKAKSSLGKPDQRYIAVTFEPNTLREAIFHQVFLNFLEICELNKWLSPEELAAHRAGAQQAFAPLKITETDNPRMEDPEIFLQLLRSWFNDHPEAIAGQGQSIGKSTKILGAIRTIGKDDSKKDFLILHEPWLDKVYLSLARKAKYDVSFSAANDWKQKMQRLLCEADILKHSGTNYRYRYDLFENGSRDTTYVLAIPLALLKE